MPQLIHRYTVPERVNHWMVAASFVLLTLSGLALFLPEFFVLSYVLGGGTWSRILHPFIGVLLALGFGRMALRYWNDNKITDTDRQWMKRIGDVIRNRDQGLPEVGKYNPGQKYQFWIWVVSILLLFVSGVVMWQPYFTPYFTVGVVRVAVLVHAFSAFVAILGLIAHVYAGVMWVRGSLRAMTRGTVTASWAKEHHPAWYRSVSKGAK
ncbi:MAG TPA: formate dehydrogenase subunit gamma [Acidiferrobacterales bacterium]|nr:formate dehydrogenase subunit gamma [Acidiferrobacterales bacterium]